MSDQDTKDYCETVARDLELVFMNYENAYSYMIRLMEKSIDKYDFAEKIGIYYRSIISSVADSLDQHHGPDNIGSLIIKQMCFSLPYRVYELLADRFYELKED